MGQADAHKGRQMKFMTTSITSRRAAAGPPVIHRFVWNHTSKNVVLIRFPSVHGNHAVFTRQAARSKYKTLLAIGGELDLDGVKTYDTRALSLRPPMATAIKLLRAHC